jgi:hypothetical protein
MYFFCRLLDRVQNEDPQWKETGSAFISSVTRLLERLLDYRSVIQGDENRDKRMSCTVNLLVSLLLLLLPPKKFLQAEGMIKYCAYHCL